MALAISSDRAFGVVVHGHVGDQVHAPARAGPDRPPAGRSASPSGARLPSRQSRPAAEVSGGSPSKRSVCSASSVARSASTGLPSRRHAHRAVRPASAPARRLVVRVAADADPDEGIAGPDAALGGGFEQEGARPLGGQFAVDRRSGSRRRRAPCSGHRDHPAVARQLRNSSRLGLMTPRSCMRYPSVRFSR